jgi:carbon monoxide dehydrogenase subunit G
MRNVLVGTAAALGIAFASAGGALAVEVSKEVTVKATPADVWKKIGGWCSIRNWHPAIATCEMTEVDGDTWRMLTTGDGAKIKEKRTAQGDMSYGYTITESPLPIANYNATIGVAPNEDGTMTKITWNANFDAKGASDEEAQKAIEGIFESGLNSVQESMN